MGRGRAIHREKQYDSVRILLNSRAHLSPLFPTYLPTRPTRRGVLPGGQKLLARSRRQRAFTFYFCGRSDSSRAQSGGRESEACRPVAVVRPVNFSLNSLSFIFIAFSFLSLSPPRSLHDLQVLAEGFHVEERGPAVLAPLRGHHRRQEAGGARRHQPRLQGRQLALRRVGEQSTSARYEKLFIVNL